MKMDKLGSDTEMFLVDKKSGSIIPGHPGLIPGTKDKPFQIGDYASLQLDNVLAEVTFPPSVHPDMWVHNVQGSKAEVKNYLNSHGLKPAFVASHHFKARELATAWGTTLGCEPDHSCDIQDPCDDVKAEKFPTLRTGSGHIHISLKAPATADEILHKVRILDIAIGAPLSLYNDGAERRTMYGRAGRFRFKPEYPGFEYRAPDNFWYGHFTAGLLHDLFCYVQHVIDSNYDGGYIRWLNKNHSDVCRAINEGNEDLVRDFISQSPFGGITVPDPKGKKKVKKATAKSRMSPRWASASTTATANWPGTSAINQLIDIEDY